MNFDQVETFLTLVKIGSFTRAAIELNVTQPAVTARITTLEEELNCKLFTMEKNKRPVLTKEGQLFFNYADRIINDLYDAKKAIDLSKKPKIEFGFSPNISSHFISEFSREIMQKNIFTSFRRGYSSDQTLKLTKMGELAVSFVYNPALEQSLIAEEIASLRLQFIVSKDHPLAKVDEIHK